jgi:tetratricopeptide (TPR) repeat protein
VTDKAEYYHRHGLRLFAAGRLQEAVEFFTKAIEINPQFPEAYLHRGGIYLETNRIVEGNSDIQKAKDLRSGKIRKKIQGRSGGKIYGKPRKVNWKDVESIYEAVFSMDSREAEKDVLAFNDGMKYGLLPDDPTAADGAGKGYARPASGIPASAAIVELLNGRCLNIARVRLFAPTDNDISIIREDGHVERVIPLEHIACIRQVDVPPELKKSVNPLYHAETIETADGHMHHAVVYPDQNRENVLFGFSAREQPPVYKFIPVVNIRTRCQERYLGEILLEKRFIGKDILKQALEEHRQAKKMKLGKIIAQKAKVMYAAIEEELEREKLAKVRNGLKTGELLLSSGLADAAQVQEALRDQDKLRNIKIGQFLIEKGIVREKEIYIALAEKFKMPFVDLRKQKLFRETLKLFSKAFVIRKAILPVSLVNDILTVAVPNPDVSCLREEISKECRCRDVRFVLAQPTHLRIIIEMLCKKNWLAAG